METLWLRLRAPFAAFRWMQAGVWRGTSPIVSPSAAWGLVLNLAGIESRAEGEGVTTLVRSDAPPLRLAIGELGRSEKATLYQQLHSYPVGNSGADFAERAHGSKYWIAPVRRELLVGFDAVVGVQSVTGEVLEKVRKGLRGELTGGRYGLPFAGDNNLLFDRIEVLDAPRVAKWYARVTPGDQPRKGSCHLTIGIDRADSSRTTTAVFAPVQTGTGIPPDLAWTWTPHEPEGR